MLLVAVETTRWKFREWWQATATSTFSALLPELFAGAFGGRDAGRFVHARVLTDFSDSAKHLEFGGTWSGDIISPFVLYPEAPSTRRITTSDFGPGLRIAVLIHYCPRGSDLIGLAGERLPVEPFVGHFEQERAVSVPGCLGKREAASQRCLTDVLRT